MPAGSYLTPTFCAPHRPLPPLQALQQYEDDQATLRSLRMGLRQVTLRLLNNKRWKAFWMPGENDPSLPPSQTLVPRSPLLSPHPWTKP